MNMDYDRERRRKRILAITEAMLTNMVLQADAKAAYDAAVEYLC